MVFFGGLVVRIGDLLVRSGLVSEDALATALSKQQLDKKTPLGQILKLLNYLNEDELDLVLQAQRKILFASMSGELAVAAIKYAKQNKLSFGLATEKVLVTLRGQQSGLAESASTGTKSMPPPPSKGETTDTAPPVVKMSAARFEGDPLDLMQQSDKAAAQQQWEIAIELLERARTMFERSDAYADDASIPVYCRLAAIYSKTNRLPQAKESIERVTRMLKSGTKMNPGSVTLLAAAANLSSRQGLSSVADQVYKIVLPRWTDLLPFEAAQFNLCLRDAINCSRLAELPTRKNIRIGELLIDCKLLNAEQFQDALTKTKRLRKPLGRVLTESGLLSMQDLRNVVRVQLLCRAAVLPSEYATATLRAASLAGTKSQEFFDKLNVPLETVSAPPGSLAELVAKMDRLLLMEEMHGVQHPEVAVLADELGDICLKREEEADAEALFRRAHAVFAVAGERYQLNLGGVCLKIGRLLVKQKKYPEAELLLLQVMEIKDRLLGDRHPEVAEVLIDVGYLYFCQANYSPAIGFLRSSWMIQQEDASREQKRYLLELLIKCFEQSGQDAESDIYREQLREIRTGE